MCWLRIEAAKKGGRGAPPAKGGGAKKATIVKTPGAKAPKKKGAQ